MVLALLTLIALLVFAVVWSVLFFYRDPERKVIRADYGVLSPADGTVISVRRYSAGTAPVISKNGRHFRVEEMAGMGFFGSDGTIISIHISPTDIHTIRSPADAVVTHVSKIRGELRFMRDPSFEIKNERVSVVLQTSFGKVGVVIVGAPIASSVETLVKVGDQVQAGGRIARIRLGSLANLIIPDDCELKPAVSCGEKVLAGMTVVAEYAKSSIEECYSPKGSTVTERLYLILLAAYALIKRLRN